jgi:hypothetical protein
VAAKGLELMGGFFDEFEPSTVHGDGTWIGKDEKEAMIKSYTPMVITNVIFESTGGYQDTPRYKLEVNVESGPDGTVEKRLIGFALGSDPDNPTSRDMMLDAMAGYFEREKDKAVAPTVVMVKPGGGNFVALAPYDPAADPNAPFS